MASRRHEQLAAAIRADRTSWQEVVSEVGRDRMNEPGPMGDWTFKDLAGHLAGWRDYRIALFEAVARGEPQPPSPWPAELNDDDRINDWIRAADRDRSLDEVLAEYDGSFERLANAIEALPENEAADRALFEWGGSAAIDGEYVEHFHEEHEPDVRAWLARRGG
jgi:hypothetical protein